MNENKMAQGSYLGLAGRQDPIVHIEAVDGGYLVSSWGNNGNRRQVVTKPDALAEFVKAFFAMHATLEEMDRAERATPRGVVIFNDPVAG